MILANICNICYSSFSRDIKFCSKVLKAFSYCSIIVIQLLERHFKYCFNFVKSHFQYYLQVLKAGYLLRFHRFHFLQNKVLYFFYFLIALNFWIMVCFNFMNLYFFQKFHLLNFSDFPKSNLFRLDCFSYLLIQSNLNYFQGYLA